MNEKILEFIMESVMSLRVKGSDRNNIRIRVSSVVLDLLNKHFETYYTNAKETKVSATKLYGIEILGDHHVVDEIVVFDTMKYINKGFALTSKLS